MIIDFYNRGGGGDMSDYYTKEDINALIADFVTASTDDLVNYYLKSETYTQAEIEALVGQITSFEVVATLPQSDIKTNVIYLLGPTGSGADRYEEYIYSNNTWTKIGETSIDLSNYVTISQLNTALGFYTTTLDLNLLLAGKQDTLTAGDRINISTQNVISADSQILSLTQQEYDALGTNIDPDVVYVITDATPVTLATVATTGRYNDLINKPTLARVAISGSYNDLTNKLAPGTGISIGTDNVISVSGSQTWYGTQQEFEALGTNLDPDIDYYISGDIDYSEIANTPTLATVATTGDYDDLTNKPTIPVIPTLATVATSGSYNDLTDKPSIPVVPTLATVATSGSYNDLTDKPTIPVIPTLATVATTGVYSDLTGTPVLSTVATSGSYNDLTDKPTIPVIPTLATVATSGAYSDLSGTPSLSTVATTGAYADLTGTPVLGTTSLVFTLADSSVVTYTVYISTISQQ